MAVVLSRTRHGLIWHNRLGYGLGHGSRPRFENTHAARDGQRATPRPPRPANARDLGAVHELAPLDERSLLGAVLAREAVARDDGRDRPLRAADARLPE